MDGSWLNVAEVEIRVMARLCWNRRIDATVTMSREVVAWQSQRDGLEAKVGWQFTSDDARIKLKCLDPTLDE